MVIIRAETNIQIYRMSVFILLSGYSKWANRILWVAWWHPLEVLLSRNSLIFKISKGICHILH